tara:strand:+ start:916 stop:1809 length:894 start_codon:yes stop_codon:yes gene_type:complete
MNITVQTVDNDWQVLPGGLTWFFVGQPKTGKTTAASKWSEKGSNGVLVLDADLGADFVEGANVVPITSLNIPYETEEVGGEVKLKMKDVKGKKLPIPIKPEARGYYHRTGKQKGKPMPVYSLAEALAWLKKDWDKLPYDTIVLDTVGEVNSWIEDIVKKEMNITAMGQGEWGSDWGAARRKNVDILKRMQSFVKKVGANLILIGHSKMTAVTDGRAQLSPELPSGLSRAITAKADVIGYITGDKSGGGYTISFKSYDERMIGSRLAPLAQKELPLDFKAVVDEIKNHNKETEVPWKE